MGGQFFIRCFAVLRYVSANALERLLHERHEKATLPNVNGGVLSAIHSSLDVLPGVLEGGFTVWDGCKLMVEILLSSSTPISGSSVLDLGCGCGLPGIAALKLGASSVTFQDYNREVLSSWTIPNVILNQTDGYNAHLFDLSAANFLKGDWLEIADSWLCADNPPKYDLILSTETIYRTDLFPRLHRVIQVGLSPAGTVMLVCSSTYGTGGTLDGFLEFVRAQGIFSDTVTCITVDSLMRYLVTLKRSNLSRTV